MSAWIDEYELSGSQGEINCDIISGIASDTSGRTMINKETYIQIASVLMDRC